ncbi:hypothetical protein Y032_0049g1787 [Ancylostoma ceylanicum]|uniref:Transthyretin-like family protein n=1 Tax=Ancylostoma ceylanicum TaxID=53326 RepID=A0A016UAD0_9BILA|nr:hypothetical protein Y032_0049g1787 [Ancylostoma ceylanicum]
MQLIILLSLVGSSLALLGIGRTQSVAVSGRLICNGRPAAGVKVKLYEKESTFDVKMAEGVTNQNGEFMLSGSKTEISTIDPKLNVYHKCNYNGVCSAALLGRLFALKSFISALLPKVRYHYPGQLRQHWQKSSKNIRRRNDQPCQPIYR